MYRQKVISWSSWALLYWLGFWSYLIVIQAQNQVSCKQSSFDSLVLSILKYCGWNLIDSIYFTYKLRLILFTSFQMLLLGTPKHFLFKQLDYLGSAFPISLGALPIFSFLLLCIHICDNNQMAISFHFQRQDWYGCSSFWCIENWSWISSFCYPRSNQFSCCCIQGMLGFTLLNNIFFFHPVREKFYSQSFHCQHAIARFVTLQAVFFLKAASSWFNYYGVSYMFFSLISV